MKKINIKHINETIYHEKLANGMNIYLYPTKKCNNNYVTFTTKFGSINNEFIPINENKTVKVPLGIAHFLEHKVFAQKKDPQPSEYFSKSGTMSNAFTTFKNTTYLFSGTNNLVDNIKYLLDFVQEPYFTDENVKSEQGIIEQEINMCNDRPMDVMYEQIRKTTLHTNHYKDSIIGEVKDIKSINKELLYKCYNTFYHPSNMFLVITGNFDKDEVINAIIENQDNKNYKPTKEIKIKQSKEKDNIVKKKVIINMNTNIPKISYNIKIPVDKFKLDKRILNIYMHILFSILFDESSKFDEEIKDKGIATNSTLINVLYTDTHIIVSLLNETYKYNEYIKEIIKTLDNINITEKDLERKKRVLISNEIFSYENIEIVNEMIIDSIIFDNKIEENMIDKFKKINIDELNKLINNIDFNNNSIVILKSKNEE